MSAVQTEQVLVVPTEVFHQLGHFQGFCGQAQRYLEELLSPEHVSYRPRGEMEEDPSFKQLIPYAIFRHAASDGAQRLFAYTRGGGQGEKRLHAKRSIGVGGHISLDDVSDESELHPYDEGLRRELEEEIICETSFRQRCVGLINDDETEVGRVHLGVVHIFDVDQPRIRPREDDILDAAFKPVGQLLDEVDAFETWSQICLRALFGNGSE